MSQGRSRAQRCPRASRYWSVCAFAISGSRSRWIAASAAPTSPPARSVGTRWLAATTASRSAMLMPWARIGDIG